MTESAVVVGLRASGRPAFSRGHLAGRFGLVGEDLFPRGARGRQARQTWPIEEEPGAGRPVAVGDTRPSPEERRPLVAAGHAHGATVLAHWFPPDPAGSPRREALRAARARVPDAGVRATSGRPRRPTRAAGFDAVHAVRRDGRGGREIHPTA
ncbi:ATP-binding protein [Streptomyces similanensis]|uniref:Uncharacterized protein n=1 Tax=Streptomyces similanensis TaxID=1274988 RepID=A0ABP9K0N6_9ACTN